MVSRVEELCESAPRTTFTRDIIDRAIDKTVKKVKTLATEKRYALALAGAIFLYQPTDSQGKPGVSEAVKAYCVNTSERTLKILRDFSISGNGSIDYREIHVL